MLQFFCTHCGQPMVANEARAGTTATCPGCKGTVTVPGPALTAPVAPQSSPPPVTPPPLPPSFQSAPVQPPPFRPATSLPPPLRTKGLSGRLVAIAFLVTAVAWLSSMGMASGKYAAVPGASQEQSIHRLALMRGATAVRLLELVALASVPALIFAAIRLAARKSFARSFAMAYSLGLLMMTFVAASVPIMDDSDSARPAQADAKPSKDFEKRVEETTKKIIAARGVPDRPGHQLPPKPAGPAITDLDRWNERCRELTAEAEAIGPDYNKELEACGFNRLVAPDRLMADKDFRESRLIIEAGQKAVQRARQRTKDIIASMAKSVDDLHLSPEAAAAARKPLEQNLDKMAAPMEGLFEVEEKIIGSYVEMARYLDFIRPYWTLEDKKMMYQRQSDQDQIKKLLQQIKDGRARQEEIKKELATFMATIIERQKDREAGK